MGKKKARRNGGYLKMCMRCHKDFTDAQNFKEHTSRCRGTGFVDHEPKSLQGKKASTRPKTPEGNQPKSAESLLLTGN